MKKLIRFALVAWTVLAACACTKTSADRFSGSYTFKTNGSLLLESFEDRSTRLTVPLLPAGGRMDITRLDQDGRVLVSFNTLGGPVEVFQASVDRNILRLDEKEFDFTAGLGSKTFRLGFLEFYYSGVDLMGRLTVSGTGHFYDDHTLFVEFTCRGPVDVAGKLFEATGVDLICNATKN